MLKIKSRYWLFFLLILFFPLQPFSHNKQAELIVWNVGQGQMVTYSTPSLCIHFDMGGEVFPAKKLSQECRSKQNRVFFSHWDWDHINFAKRAYKRLNHLCRLNEPGGRGTKKKKEWLFTVPMCQPKSIENSQKIFRELVFYPYQNKDKKHTASNKASRVIVIQNKILIPGDSPGSSEKLWIGKIKAPIEILIASHHGSRYSTTHQLLQHLPHLHIAVASARRKRYGHPHPLLKKRLAKRGVPLLSTEEFNHIRLPTYDEEFNQTGRKPTERGKHCLIGCPSVLNSRRKIAADEIFPTSKVQMKQEKSTKTSIKAEPARLPAHIKP